MFLYAVLGGYIYYSDAKKWGSSSNVIGSAPATRGRR